MSERDLLLTVNSVRYGKIHHPDGFLGVAESAPVDSKVYQKESKS